MQACRPGATAHNLARGGQNSGRQEAAQPSSYPQGVSPPAWGPSGAGPAFSPCECTRPRGSSTLPAPQVSAHQASLPHRNILRLINAFDLPDQSISRDDYTAVLARLNVSRPEWVAGLHLDACRLEDFLEKVLEGPGRGHQAALGRVLAAHGPLGSGVQDFRLTLCLCFSELLENPVA